MCKVLLCLGLDPLYLTLCLVLLWSTNILALTMSYLHHLTRVITESETEFNSIIVLSVYYYSSFFYSIQLKLLSLILILGMSLIT